MPLPVALAPPPVYERARFGLSLLPRRTVIPNDLEVRQWQLGVMTLNPDDLRDLDAALTGSFGGHTSWAVGDGTKRRGDPLTQVSGGLDDVLKLPEYQRRTIEVTLWENAPPPAVVPVARGQITFYRESTAVAGGFNQEVHAQQAMVTALQTLVASAQPRYTTDQLLRAACVGVWAVAGVAIGLAWAYTSPARLWPILVALTVLLAGGAAAASSRIMEISLRPSAHLREGLRLEPDSRSERRLRRIAFRDAVKVAAASTVIGILIGYAASRVGIG